VQIPREEAASDAGCDRDERKRSTVAYKDEEQQREQQCTMLDVTTEGGGEALL
jgi:hypothetical protein